jgi:hypothetical protein
MTINLSDYLGHMKKGLAQKSPNIDFSRFLYKRVAVKFKNGSSVIIDELTESDSYSFFLKGIGWYNQSAVEVIYDEDAFNLELQEIPVDESIKKVVDLAKGMTTEQIAEVISRLKGDTKRLSLRLKGNFQMIKTDPGCTKEYILEMSKLEGDAHELWALAQLAPGEGICDGVDRIIEFLNKHYNR